MTTATIETPTMLRMAAPRGLRGGKVDRENFQLFGVSVITAGQPKGHAFFADGEFVDQVIDAGNKVPGGVMMRFNHPSFGGGGKMGDQLARATNFRRVKGRAVADATFIDAAINNLPERVNFVMDLAEKDPDMFGLSIALERDRKAEEKFLLKNGATKVIDVWGTWIDITGFKSPDKKNKLNFPHLRLKTLEAADFVDKPALNPKGLFAAGDCGCEMNRMLAYAVGVDDQAGEDPFLGEQFKEAREIVKTMLSARGMHITSRPVVGSEPEQQTREGADMDLKDVKANELRAENPALVTELESAAKGDEVARFKALKDAFPDRPEFAMAQFEAGSTIEQAKVALCDVLQAEILEAKKAPTAAEAAATAAAAAAATTAGAATGTTAIPHGDSGIEGGGGCAFLQRAEELAEKEGIDRVVALKRLAKREPKLYTDYMAWASANPVPKGRGGSFKRV